MGNGKFYEIGTSLAETAFMANGLIPDWRVERVEQELKLGRERERERER